MVFFKGMPRRLHQLGRQDADLIDIAKILGKLGTSEPFCDVIIHCKSQSKVSANKYLLSQRSKLLRSAFGADSGVLLCPDFDYEPMREVLNLLSQGEVITGSQVICDSMMEIMKALQIDIDVSAHPYPYYSSTLADSITTLSDHHQIGFNGIEAFSEQDEAMQLNFKVQISEPSLSTEDREITTTDEIAEPEEASIAASEMVTDDGSVSVAFDDNSSNDISLNDNSSHVNASSDNVSNCNSLIDNSSNDNSMEETESKSVAECEMCGKRFSTTFALNRHLTKHNNSNLVSEKQAVTEDQNDQFTLEQNPDGVERKPNVTLEFVIGESFEASSDETSMDENQNASNVVDAMADSPPNPELLRQMDNKIKFSCRFCNRIASSQGNMVMHLAGSHYRSRILKMNENDERLCRICDKNFGNIQGLLYHIASVHRVLPDIFSNEMSLDHLSGMTDMKRRKKKNKAKRMAKQTSHDQQHQQQRTQPHQGQPRKKPLKTNSVTSASSSKYQCHKCPFKTQSYNLLLCHIGSLHYITELESLLASNSSQCPQCFRVMQRRDNLRRHMLMTHDALKGLLPSKSELQVPNEVAEFQCQLCPKQSSNRLKILMHMAASHFKEKLLSKYSVDNACTNCNKKCSDRKSLLLHLVINHRVVSNLITGNKS